ncbi:MAG: DEAD/DEAH box helicase [Polyangiaceae bacterium]|nr:DEAD/DEAH box helicase [Polyangiaceae bacterium]
MEPLAPFRDPVRTWFRAALGEPTVAQRLGWPPIASGKSTLLLAPTGSGKTLAAFLSALDKILFSEGSAPRLRVVYVSPLKALAVDVERNLRAPLVGITAAAERLGVPVRAPVVAVRSGDTPQRERAALVRGSADILITTPESLYLLLTSEARKHFATVETVILDEIHAVAGTKRGAHMFLSLERLEALRDPSLPPLQRVGLSATARPAEVIARAFGGFSAPAEPRPVEIVDAGARRAVEIKVELPIDDFRALADREDSGPRAAEGRSIWPSIYPRIVELIRAHRTTLVFVNNRRTAERLAAALNEIAEEEIALAHHGSIALDRRVVIEDRLKSGSIPAIVATSSLELGIDMGSVDLVVLIEAPPSVAAGLQRVGRSGHRAGAVSKGILFPKFRGDLLACAASSRAMAEGEVEATAIPENPLDVLAQQIVATVSLGPVHEAALYDQVRRAAPFSSLPRGAYEGVLDMLSGRYPSDEFAELRPRVVWDRVTGELSPRHGARRLAVVSGGTIPDRGLFPVFLAGGEGKSVRVGELDEEMVFESRVGEVFLLGASSWRIEDITHDRVLVSPAPGEPGKMPFWKGDKPGRPLELGIRIGALSRKLAETEEGAARALLSAEFGLDERAATNLARYVHEQKEATGEVPSDRTIVVERFRDELGDQRVCILTPMGSRILSAWATAVTTKLRDERNLDIDAIWTDDGIAFRLADVETAPELSAFIPLYDEVEDLVVRGLDQTAIFASRFRENAARALLLPRRTPGKRSPLWAQRKRAADLRAVASRYGSFPIILETYRECLRDTLDMPALVALLKRVNERALRVVSLDVETPSPFASGILFSYVAAFMYEGDAPLAERRAQALSLDQERLRELLGEVELRELLDEDAIRDTEAALQHLSGRKVRHADALHDLLLVLGDLEEDEIVQRTEEGVDGRALAAELALARRIVRVTIAHRERFIAIEDTGRFRDAVGVMPPPGIPQAFLEPAPRALAELAARYGRSHGPFEAEQFAARYGLGRSTAAAVLGPLVASGKLLSGSFTPGRTGEELCDPEVLRTIKRRSLARLRREVEPVPQAALGRFLGSWHELDRPKAGIDATLSVIEQLEGVALPASVWLEDVLPRRVRDFRASDLDDLCSAGEILWRGVEPIGTGDGRIAFHLADRYGLLAAPTTEPAHARVADVLAVLERRGAVFFSDLVTQVGGFANDILEALWDLVFAGMVTNDTTTPIRSYFKLGAHRERSGGRPRLRTRRALPPGSEGRWSLLPKAPIAGISDTDRRTALANVLLERYGVVTREVVQAENIAGGFGAVYPILKVMEEAGRVRRGYFIEGLGAAQFARAGVDERLRALRDPSTDANAVLLAATDPANPYGAALPWPEGEPRPQRAAGAHVILVDGALGAFIGRGDENIALFLPPEEPDRSRVATAVAVALSRELDRGAKRAITIAKIDGIDAASSAVAPTWKLSGFVVSGSGLLVRRG